MLTHMAVVDILCIPNVKMQSSVFSKFRSFCVGFMYYCSIRARPATLVQNGENKGVTHLVATTVLRYGSLQKVISKASHHHVGESLVMGLDMAVMRQLRDDNKPCLVGILRQSLYRIELTT